MEKQDILHIFFSGNKQVPTIPVLYAKFNKLIENSLTSNKQIADLFMKDQGMMTKILRLSNSVIYAKRREITDLSNAITFLGLETLRQIVLQASLVKLFKTHDPELPEFNVNTFWEHSLGTAYFASLLPSKLGIPGKEDYYLGGLLHDVGKLLIYQFYPVKFKEIILLQINNGMADFQAEEEVLGVNHTDIGAYFAEKWNFHPEIIGAIRDHHQMDSSSGLNVTLVRVANMFAKAAGFCFPWDFHILDLVSDTSWQMMSGLITGNPDLTVLVEQILAEADNIRETVRDLLKETG